AHARLEPLAPMMYELFGSNARMLKFLSSATPKRDYYAQTARGNRLFELGLGPVALALTAASSPDDQRLIDRCLAEGGGASFAAQFLAAKGLAWAAELLSRSPRPAVLTPTVAPSATPIASAEGAPGVLTASPNGSAPAPTAAASPSSRDKDAAPLPGLPGGPLLSERLSPFRVVSPARQRRIRG